MSKEVWVAQEDISYEQLIEYLKLTRTLPALCQLMPLASRELALKSFWDTCTKRVNGIKGGAIKSVTGWSQYLRYVRFRIKQRLVEITSGRKISKVPEDDYIPISELDRLIYSYLCAIEDQRRMTYEFDPTKSRYWAACAPQPAATRKRRLSASDIVIKRKKQMPETDSEDKNGEGDLSTDTSDPPIYKRRQRSVFDQNYKVFNYYYMKNPTKKSSAPAIRRSLSFTDMRDAIECTRKLKLEMIAEKTKPDPVSVKKRESERTKYVRFVTVMLRANLIDALRILSYTSVFKEILKNNPQYQNTISETPIIF